MDYRLNIKLKNNRILQQIEEAGYSSISEFCRSFNLSYQTVISLAGIKRPALTKSGHYTKSAQLIADALGCNPEDLFTDTQAAANLKTSVSRKISEQVALSFSDPETRLLESDSPEEVVEAKVSVSQLLPILSERERDIMIRHFGIGCSEESIEEIANSYGLSRARVDQLRLRALRKMNSRYQRSMRAA
jgi:RNA polymerase sigma factor (sigma-70 family)